MMNYMHVKWTSPERYERILFSTNSTVRMTNSDYITTEITTKIKDKVKEAIS